MANTTKYNVYTVSGVKMVSGYKYEVSENGALTIFSIKKFKFVPKYVYAPGFWLSLDVLSGKYDERAIGGSELFNHNY